MPLLIHEAISYNIIEACIKVHSFLDHVFLKIVYKDAMQIELLKMKWSFQEKRV